MKVSIILPRNMNFSTRNATSIDLYAWTFAVNSKFSDGTTIVGESSEEALPGVHFKNLLGMNRRQKISAVSEHLDSTRPDLVVVHQHVPTASSIAVRSSASVLIVKHSLEAESNLIKKFRYRLRYKRISKIVTVSQAARENFSKLHPYLSEKTIAIHNCFNVQDWRCEEDRRKEILVVGTCVPQKGILESALAVSEALRTLSDWTATFILTGTHLDPNYLSNIEMILSSFGDRARIVRDQPWSAVKEANERASIALVLSIGQESFGRTAAEAHAGGAVLISSGRGGLREVSGDAAVYVDPSDVGEVSANIRALANSPEERARRRRSGRDHVASAFDVKVVVPQMDDLYASLVHPDSASSR